MWTHISMHVDMTVNSILNVNKIYREYRGGGYVTKDTGMKRYLKIILKLYTNSFDSYVFTIYILYCSL